MKRVILVILFLVPIIVMSQNIDVLGEWSGEWSNQKGHYFTFNIDLREDSAGEIEGEFIWKLIKSPRASEQSKLGLTATEYVKGSYDNSSKKLNIKGFKEEDPNRIIALDSYDLKLSDDGSILDGKTEYHGSWKGHFYAKREVQQKNNLVNKQKFEGRTIVTTKEVKVQNGEIVIEFWDNGKEDGDIISLNLNGGWILRNCRVKKSKGEIVLPITTGENVLILHAENLGQIPPNTSAISILENGKKIEEIVLNSDMGKSEAIKIVK